MSRLVKAVNASLARFLPEQTLTLKTRVDQRELTLSPFTRLLLLSGTTLAIGWLVVATSATISSSFESDNAQARSDSLQDAYELRLAELAAERDAFAVQTQAMQDRFSLALQQVSTQQDELIDAMTVQNEQEITLFALQRKLNSVTAERNAAQAGLDGLQAEFAASSAGTGPRESTEHELKVTVNALNAVLDETLQTRDASIEYTNTLEAQIEEAAQRVKLDAQRRDRMIAQLEEAVLVSFGPLETMLERTGLDVDSLIANVRRNYSGSGGLSGALDEAAFLGMDAPDLRLEALMRDLDTVQIYNITAAKLPLAIPVQTTFRYSSSFGPRNGRLHKGVDMAGATGSPIYATADGVVNFAGWQTGYGNVVKITHEFGFETVYAHLNKIHVTKGQRVSREDRIADMGNTGRSSGPHLHYEVRTNGNAVNPMNYIKAGQNVF